MTGYIGVFVLGVLLAWAAAWFLYMEDARRKLSERTAQLALRTKEVDERNEAIKACWSASFGGFGAPAALATQIYNALWRLVGFEEKGAPKGG